MIRRLLWPTAVLVLGGALTFVLYGAARHFVPMNSDNATLVLEGSSIRAGDLGLHGWALALDSFWTSEAPIYALGLGIGIGSATMLYLGPALLGAATVLVGMGMALGSGRGWRRMSGPLVVLALLGVPAPALAFYFLQGSWHVGTAFLCLVAYAGIGFRSRLGAVIAVVSLALALLGDLQAVVFGVAPVLVAALIGVGRARHWRGGVGLAAIGVAALVLAFAVHGIAEALGSFSVLGANPTPPLAHELTNIGRLVPREAGLFGVVAMPVHTATGGPFLVRLVHGLGFAAVVGALVVALAGLAVALWRARAASGASLVATTTVDDLLLLAFAGDLADFIVLAATGNGNYARYLSASVIFGVVLAGRTVSRLVAGASPARSRGAIAVCAAYLAAAVGAFAFCFSLPAAAEEPSPLGTFLAAHGLTHGVGDYWSSSIVTVDTDAAVLVRPVIEDPAGRLVRYGRQSTAGWYSGAHFDFVVFDTKHPWRGVDQASATATFGVAEHTYAVGSYRILVYRRAFAISPVGYSR